MIIGLSSLHTRLILYTEANNTFVSGCFGVRNQTLDDSKKRITLALRKCHTMTKRVPPKTPNKREIRVVIAAPNWMTTPKSRSTLSRGRNRPDESQ